MKLLEARFHPRSKKAGAPIAVARVVCEDTTALVEPFELPARRLEPFDGNALMAKLNSLVESARPGPYEQLTTLKSEFWSFVDVAGDRSEAQ
jgi:hypothetical protein